MLRLKEKYNKEVVPQMKEAFGYKNVLAVPKIEKVIVNNSFGRLVSGKSRQDAEKLYKNILEDLAIICGQSPVITRAKKSISGFKLREGMPVGAKVTLRKAKMYDFLDRLIHIVFPRTRDFAGLKPELVDKEGNLTIGIKEQIVFPEITAEKISKMFGLEITIVMSSKSREESLALLRLLGFPFKKDKKEEKINKKNN